MLRRLQTIDWILVGALLPIIGAGLITMRSFVGETPFFERQLFSALVALAVFFAASQFDTRLLRRTDVLVKIFLGGLAILLLVFVIGTTAKGATSWLRFGGFSFQPSDLMKLVVILMLAKYFSRRHVEIGRWKHLIISGLYAFIPFLLVFLQPDFGSAMIIIIIWFGMVLISGLGRKQLLILLGIAATAFALLWSFVFVPYQKARIQTFFQPMADIQGSGYNVYQSIIAVGSGQVMGKGVGYGSQSRLQFLPEHQTDFIFAAFAEEWGFVGSVVLLGLYVVVLWRILENAKRGETNFEILYGLGVVVFFLSHIIINIGMNIGLLPVTGITLPLMSYGGSHLLIELLALGLLMGMRRYARVAHADHMKNEFVGLV